MMDERHVAVTNAEMEKMIRYAERCEIMKRMVKSGMIITDATLKAVFDIEVKDDDLSI